MVGGAAKGKRRSPARQSGQEHLEVRGVFDREHASQPAAVIVGDEPRLHAAKSGALAKRSGGLAQLVRLGPILRIEDDDYVAAREGSA